MKSFTEKHCPGRTTAVLWPRESSEQVWLHAEFTREEQWRSRFLLWESDRDGSIAVDDFVHREPELSGKFTLNVIPKHLQRTYLAYLVGGTAGAGSRGPGRGPPALATRFDD